MSETFDPYQKWLGIRPKDQPPNHYRLLGLELYENDADSIANAADRQMSHLHTFQNGRHAPDSQRILNELASAKVCLLDEEKKQAYDERLRTSSSAVVDAEVIATATPIAPEPVVLRPVVLKPVELKPAEQLTSASDVIITGPPSRSKTGGAGSPPGRPDRAGVTAPTIAASPRRAPSTKPNAKKPNAESEERPPWFLPAVIGGSVLGLIAVLLIVLAASGMFSLEEPDYGSRNVAGRKSTSAENDAGKTDETKTSTIVAKTTTKKTIKVVIKKTEPTPFVPRAANPKDPFAVDPVSKDAKVEVAFWGPVGKVATRSRYTAGTDQFMFKLLGSELEGLEFAAGTQIRPLGSNVDVKESGDVYLAVASDKRSHFGKQIESRGGKVTSIACEIFVRSPPGRSVTKSYVVYRLGVSDDFYFSSDHLDVLMMAKSVRRASGVRQPATTEPGKIAKKDPQPKRPDSKQPEPPPELVKRSKPPTAEAMRASEKEVRDIFDLDKARSAEERRAKALDLLKNAADTVDDKTAQYVMYRLARDLAAGAGDLPTAMKAIDELTNRFEEDPAGMRVNALVSASKGKLTEKQQRQLVTSAKPIIQMAMSSDDYVSAAKLAGTMGGIARRLKDRLLISEMGQLQKSIRTMQGQYRKAESALETLKTAPDDAAANGAAGHYFAFVKGEWDKALPMLAKSNDKDVKAAAAKEVKKPGDVATQAAIAGSWYDAGSAASAITKGQLWLRSKYWYEKVVKSAASLQKIQATKRLETINASPEVKAALAAGTSSMGDGEGVTIYAACDGPFWVCLNGKPLILGNKPRVFSQSGYVKKGDVITVRARGVSGRYGFACVVKFSDGSRSISSGTSSGWTRYTPRSSTEWWNVPKTSYSYSPSVTSSSKVHLAVQQTSGVACRPFYAYYSNYFSLTIP
jgi:hypothetical protein